MATRVARRPIRHKAVVKNVKSQPSPAAAISAAYEHAERFLEAQRDLLRGLIESLSAQITHRAHGRTTVTKAPRAHRAPRKRVVARRPAKRVVARRLAKRLVARRPAKRVVARRTTKRAA
ncbi:MAG TPA: hypothetical protein VLU92_02810 [Candidatus Dormibacteraeota bacterium]|nr:hypothetical protein [Candidatus Dormibacteraeota bacterium]